MVYSWHQMFQIEIAEGAVVDVVVEDVEGGVAVFDVYLVEFVDVPAMVVVETKQVTQHCVVRLNFR